jgi:hypothetical protein
MNKFTEYMNYLASLVFGITLVGIFITEASLDDAKWVLVVSLFVIWFFPLMRIYCLSDRLTNERSTQSKRMNTGQNIEGGASSIDSIKAN